MATSSPAAGSRARSIATALPPWTGAVVLAVLVAVVLRAVYGAWYLNYDARYALLWARDALDGFSPEFLADFAPTPHPLQISFAALLLPFGEEAAGTLMAYAILACFGVLVFLTYRLGTELFGHPAVGAITALAVLTRPALQRDAVLAYQDIPFAALIVGAVLLEARQRRRGAPVLALLVLAGLLRPEAWVLAVLYVVWLWPMLRDDRRRLAAYGAAAFTAPALWALTDLVVTGDPLHSLHGTAELAAAVDRRRRIDQVPFWTAQYFGFVLREPLLLGIPFGLAFAWRRRLHQAALPVVVATAMTAVFAVGPVFGLPLIGRYIRTPSVLVAVFFAVSLCAWLLLPKDHRERRFWMGVAALVALVTLAFVPKTIQQYRALDRRVGLDSRLYTDLKDIGDNERVRTALARCGPLSTADHRPIPFIRYWIQGDPGSVGTIANRASPLGGLYLAPRRNRLTRRIFRENFPTAQPPRAYPVLYRNANWTLFAKPGCG